MLLTFFISALKPISCITFSLTLLVQTMIGPFFIAQISFIRLISLKISTQSLRRKINIAIGLLFATMASVSCAALIQQVHSIF